MPKENRELLTTIIEAFDYSDDGIAVVTEELRLLYCNRAWLEIHDLNPDGEYTGKNLREIEEARLHWVIDEGMKALRDKGVYSREVKDKRPDGSPQYVHVLANFIPHIQPPLILVLLHDITEFALAKEELKRHQNYLEGLVEERTAELTSANEQLKAKVNECMVAEKALMESEAKYRVLAEHLRDGIVVAKDDPIRLVFVNQAMAKLLGYSTDELRSLSVKDLQGLVHPDDRSIFFGRFRERLAGKRPDPHYEFRGIKKDGTVIWIAIFSSLIEYEGEPAVLAAFRDITERKRAVEALRESEEKLRTQYKSIPVPTYTWQKNDDDFVLVDYNDAAHVMTKGKITDYIGIKASEMFLEMPEIREDLLQCSTEKKSIEREILYRLRTTGEEKYFAVKCAYVPPDCVLAHTEDVTERRRAEEELKHYRDQLEELVEKRTDELRKTNDRLRAEIAERERAERELALRNRELGFLNEVYEIITSSESKGEILDRVLGPMTSYCEAPIAVVFDVDTARKELVQIKAVGVPDEIRNGWHRVSVEEESVQRLLSSSGVYIPEQDFPDAKRTSEKIKEVLGIKRTISIPLRFREQIQTVVFIGLTSDVDVASEERHAFEIVGKQLGIALERLDLLDALEKREKDLMKLAAELTHSIEEERRRMAMQLHDELSQSLVAINVEFEMLKERINTEDAQNRESLRVIDEELQRITESTRQISYSLHPSILADFGLITALERYAEKFIEKGKLSVDIEAIGFDEKLPRRISLALYRIAQEALTNIVRHADAGNVSIKLTKGYPRVIMVIEDDGKGFECTGEEAPGRGLGIVSMRERVGFLGGDFRIQSNPGKGTRIRVTVPLEVDDGSRH